MDEDNRDEMTTRLSGRVDYRGIGRRWLLSAERKMESTERGESGG